MGAALEYFRRTQRLLERLARTQTKAIEKAAELSADRIARGGLVFLFGAGHSRMMCEEMIPRQGCFPGFVALVEIALSNHASVVGPNGLRTALHLEKYEGYAEEVLNNIKFGPHDAMIVVSTSGIRPVVVEMALGARRRGLPVIAVMSLAHAREAGPSHRSGKTLADAADIVIDNQCPPGDCVLPLRGLKWRTGPASTVTGAVIINMLRCSVAERLVKKGKTPVLLPSHQFAGDADAAKQLDLFYEAYRKSLAHLYR